MLMVIQRKIFCYETFYLLIFQILIRFYHHTLFFLLYVVILIIVQKTNIIRAIIITILFHCSIAIVRFIVYMVGFKVGEVPEDFDSALIYVNSRIDEKLG